MTSLVPRVLTGGDEPVSNRPSYAEAVTRRRPSSQLVHDDQRLPGRELSSGESGSQGNASCDFNARVCEQGKREPGTRTRRRSTPPGRRKQQVDLVHHGLELLGWRIMALKTTAIYDDEHIFPASLGQRTHLLAFLRIAVVSSISAMNVETPRSWLSLAPTLKANCKKQR